MKRNEKYRKYKTISFLNYIRRTLNLKPFRDKFLIGSPFLFPILWTDKSLSYFVYSNLFYFKIIFTKKYFKMLLNNYIFVIFRLRKIVIYSSLKMNKPSKFIFSWINNSDVDSFINLNQDRIFGDINKFNEDKFVFIFLENEKLTNTNLNKMLATNSIILRQEKTFFIRNFFIIAHRFIKNFKSIFKNNLNTLSFFSYDFQFSENILCKINSIIMNENSKPEYLILPYEGQPFQIKVSASLQEKGIKVIGYLHDVLLFFPSTLIKKRGTPNTLITVSSENKRVLTTYCGWNENEIIETNSIRQTIKPENYFAGKFFLSYEINNKEIVISNLNQYLKVHKWKWEIPEIRIHPQKINSEEHQIFKEELVKVFERNLESNIPNKTDNLISPCICLGTTTVILEALEHGMIVIHLCDIPEIQMCDALIWKTIDVSRFNYNLCVYKLKVPFSLIRYGSNEFLDTIMQNKKLLSIKGEKNECNFNYSTSICFKRKTYE